MSERTRIAWTPEWDSMRTYVRPLVRRFGWRLRPLYDESDLETEAWLVFQKIQQTYPAVVEPALFKTLFYGSFARRMMDMQRKASYRPACLSDVMQDEDTSIEDLVPVNDEGQVEADVRMLFEFAPADLRPILELALEETRPSGLSPNRISTRLGISMHAARHALDRVRKLFSEKVAV